MDRLPSVVDCDGKMSSCAGSSPPRGSASITDPISIGRFRYIASRAERSHSGRNSAQAFNLASAGPRGALTLCHNSVWAFHPRNIPKSAYLHPIHKYCHQRKCLGYKIGGVFV